MTGEPQHPKTTPRPVRAVLIGAAAGLAALFAAVPTLDSPPRSGANEAAAIATLRAVAAAQARCRQAAVFDRDRDGIGEFAYLAELAGAGGYLQPPALSPAFMRVAPHPAAPGGAVVRSGYVFWMVLPGAGGAEVPEAGAGGRGTEPPDADRAEREWRCHARPCEPGVSGRRAFVVDQRGEVHAAPAR